MTTQSELQTELEAAYRTHHDQVAGLVRPLDPERLVRRPAPDRWSVGEVLEHLTLMDALFLDAAGNALRAARTDAGAPHRAWKPTFIGRKIVESLEAPKPLTAPKSGTPGTPRAAVREAFLAGDARFMQLLTESSVKDWNAVRLRPPVMPWLPLKLNAGDVFRIHAVHVRRHIAQIERVIKQVA